MWKHSGLLVALAGLALASAASADDAAMKCRTYVDDAHVKACMKAESCQDDKSGCGSIIYINNGLFQAQPVLLEAMGSQPSNTTINANCQGYRQVRRGKVNGAEALEFIVPASCAYRLKIEIVAGNQKSRNLFLAPGCSIRARTDGTSQNNSWKVTTSGTQSDAEGNNCGPLKQM